MACSGCVHVGHSVPPVEHGFVSEHIVEDLLLLVETTGRVDVLPLRHTDSVVKARKRQLLEHNVIMQ